MATVVAFLPARRAGVPLDLAREMAIHPEEFNLVEHYGSTLVVRHRPPLPKELVLIQMGARRRTAVFEGASNGVLSCRLGRNRHIWVHPQECLGVVCESRKRFSNSTAA